MIYLLHDYFKQAGEEKYNAIMGKLAASGVNVQRLQSFQRSYDEAMLQQQEAEQAAQEGASLEEVLGN